MIMLVYPPNRLSKKDCSKAPARQGMTLVERSSLRKSRIGRMSEYACWPIHSTIQIIPSSYQARITNQLRRLGGSLDWDRVRFTLDEVLLLLSVLLCVIIHHPMNHRTFPEQLLKPSVVFTRTELFIAQIDWSTGVFD